MEWIERLNSAIDYIEKNLTDKIDYEKLGQIACCSAYHSPTAFNRAFQSIQELEKRIVTEWLPTSGYEYGNAPDIEVYIHPDPQNAQYEVWIPVVKKSLI